MATNKSHWLKVHSRWFKNYSYLRKVYFDLAFIIPTHFTIVPYLTLWMLNFFITIRVSNSLDPDQAQHFVGPDRYQTVCKGYQQTTKVTASRQRNFLILLSGLSQFHLAPTLSIWLKCWLQQILSQGKPCLPVSVLRSSTPSLAM